MRRAAAGSSPCGRTPASPTAPRSHPPACARAGRVTARGDELRPEVSRLVQSILPIDERSLAITLRSQRPDAPLALAHPDLAIARSTADSRWPLGTRSDAAAPERQPSAQSAITLNRDNLPSLRFVVGSGDPRDLLGQWGRPAADPRSRGARLRRHAAAVPVRAAGVATSPRPPHAPAHARVSLSVGGSAAHPRQGCRSGRGAGGDGAVLVAGVAALQGRAIRAASAIHTDPANRLRLGATPLRGIWPSASSACPVVQAPPQQPSSMCCFRIVRARGYLHAAALTGESLATARRRGNDAGYIISLDRRPLDPCRDIQMLMDSARWLHPETIVPLVETRLRAVVRRTRGGITAEWDGGLLIAGVGGPR